MMLIAATMLGSAFFPGGNIMASYDEPKFSSRMQTTLPLDGGQLIITLEDAQEIKRALEAYLTFSRREIEQTLPRNLIDALPKATGDAWIDEDGSVHIGAWLLESRGGKLALTYRPSPPTSSIGYRYEAHLEQVEGQWKVSSITFAKLYYR
jgi:hypothetical protein